MLAIRLARVGRKKQPVYRVVVSEKSKDMYGDHLEILGTYNPHTKSVVLKNDRVEYWLKNGARASETVQNLFINEGLIKEEKKAKAVRITKKRQAKIAAKEEKPEEKAPEAPAEDKKEEVSAEADKAEEKVPEADKVEEAPAEDKKEEAK